MRRRSLNEVTVLWLAAALVVLNCVVVRFTDVTLVRTLVGLPSLLFAPGFLVMAACTPPRSTDGATELSFSAGVSLAVVALGSIVLDAIGLPLNAKALSVWVAAVGVLALGVALLRWWDEHAWPAPQIAVSGPAALASFASVAVVTAALAFSISWAQHTSASDRIPGFTELSVVPGTEGVVRVNVRSNETKQVRYVMTLSQRSHRAVTASLALRPGQEWYRRFAVDPASLVHITLRPVDGGALHRSVSIGGVRAVEP